MTRAVSIREYEYLSKGEGGQLTDSAYYFLREQALTNASTGQEFLVLCSRAGRECLQVKNYVGVLSTPDGTVIEILPKHTSGSCEISDSRRLLWKMLRVVYGIEWNPSTEALLQTHKKPLPELLIAKYLQSVSYLVHRGIRSDYLRVKEQRRFLKGRLNVAKQLRLPPGNATDFCIEFDEYSVNRAENRLIRLALDRVSRSKLGINNTRLSKELSIVFSDVPQSQNIEQDFSAWRKQRDMSHYQAVKPWLELILRSLSPWLFSGNWHGISMLFPMEKLFEDYLGKMLARQMTPGYMLKSQARSEYLTTHMGRKMFQLKPDFLVRQSRENYCVMDAKWKLLDQSTGAYLSKYDIKQSDLYQLYAYGHKYLKGSGNLCLIYPMHEKFDEPLASFEFEAGMKLWVVPYDLETDRLVLAAESNIRCFDTDSESMVA
jgi:5-methylcytosine-specific restriction enzyme subunit McrC